jgi:hypothetical protein
VGTIDWPRAYGERVTDFMHLATSKGARVVWAGLPIVSDTGRWGIIQRQNDVFEHSAHTVDDVAVAIAGHAAQHVKDFGPITGGGA